jgi:hypothetical protein
MDALIKAIRGCESACRGHDSVCRVTRVMRGQVKAVKVLVDVEAEIMKITVVRASVESLTGLIEDTIVLMKVVKVFIKAVILLQMPC